MDNEMNQPSRQVSVELLSKLLSAIPNAEKRAELEKLLDNEEECLVPISMDRKTVHVDGLGDIPLDYAALEGSPIVPAGRALMPRRLTAENGAKGLMIGEFFQKETLRCPRCTWSNDDDYSECEICEDEGVYESQTAITWDTIKDVYARAFDFLSEQPEALDRAAEYARFKSWYSRVNKIKTSDGFNWETDDVKEGFEAWFGHARLAGSPPI